MRPRREEESGSSRRPCDRDGIHGNCGMRHDIRVPIHDLASRPAPQREAAWRVGRPGAVRKRRADQKAGSGKFKIILLCRGGPKDYQDVQL
ncbi:hypothetical protein NDU88_000303 [Pleurodeles waltl]|uniref:Uncharacterized protein n=1 Tax=Pleurodeles waltl TaxID=8319 RepID=A0AAV7KMJ8_PLEWA|nr:hypothetical protein NDU88_000303 [Pleurodeles waltl]